MRKSSKFLTIILALSLAAGCIGPVSAADISATGGQGSVPVKLTAEALTFSVMVPTALPVNVTANGEVSVATDAKIVNNSAGPVAVKGVSVEAQNNWTLADWSADLAEKKVDTKEFAMELQNTPVATDGSCEAIFNVIAANDNISLKYDAHVAPQSTATTATIANVFFTVGWEEAAIEYEDFILNFGNIATLSMNEHANNALGDASELEILLSYRTGDRGKYYSSGIAKIPETFESVGKYYRIVAIGNLDYESGVGLNGDFSAYEFPESVNYLGCNAIFENNIIETITIPGHIKTLDNPIWECCNLKTIVLEEGVESIKGRLASEAWSVLKVIIPNSLKHIDSVALVESENFQIVYNGNTYSSDDEGLEQFRTAFLAIEGNTIGD